MLHVHIAGNTINGFGTMFYGWRHGPDNTAEVTHWIVAAFLPIVPIGNYRIQLQPGIPAQGSFAFHYITLEELEYDAVSILKTYLKAYVVLPVLFALPILAGIAVTKLFPDLDLGRHTEKVICAATFGTIFYYAMIVAKILDGAAGRTRPTRPFVNPTRLTVRDSEDVESP